MKKDDMFKVLRSYNVWFWLSVLFFQQAATLFGQGVHPAPIIAKAKELSEVARFSLDSYRLFAVDDKGNVKAIPFQLDERDPWDDFILPFGKENNQRFSNRIFDNSDELAFMGEDVGADRDPVTWSFRKPDRLFKLRISNSTDTKQSGAVFIGVYFTQAPAESQSVKNYVVWDLKNAQVFTNRYRYKFDPDNYLVVRGIDVADGKDEQSNYKYRPIINSSTFFLNIDLKYFLTLSVNHRDLNSKLDAYKAGPIRAIIRISFTYKFMKINFELGMYTEVSFFANSVILPAVMYNPVDGPKRLNAGSGFYYGFSLIDNPSKMNIETNMPEYGQSELMNMIKGDKGKDSYWIGGHSATEMLYMQIGVNPKLVAAKAVPHLYNEPQLGEVVTGRVKQSKDYSLGKGPVNIAMHFDLTKFVEGEHSMAFQLYFENTYNAAMMEQYKHVQDWKQSMSRLY